ncbi:MAG: tail fiber protein [Bacteriophage sp.]|nr:MAG: tail fiber protein [Bacteriophage sp.]
MIQDQTTKVIYVGNGQTTHFPFKFKYNDKAHIHVAIYDIDTQVQTELTKDFFIDSEKNEVIYPGYQSGQEPPEAQIPPVLQANQKLVIYRQTPLTQEIDFGSKYPLPFVENGTDKNTMISQEMKEALERSVKVDMGSEVKPDELLKDLNLKVYQTTQAAEEGKQALEETKANAEQASINAQSVNIRTFANVEEMKQVSNLKAGALVKTQGFYTAGDGGEADYIIVNDIEEETEYIPIQNNLYALMIKPNLTINFKQVGGKALEGENNNSSLLQNLINSLYKKRATIIFDDTFYFYEPVYCEKITAITFQGTSIYTDIPNVVYLGTGYLLSCNGMHSVTFKNITIKGNGENYGLSTGNTNSYSVWYIDSTLANFKGALAINTSAYTYIFGLTFIINQDAEFLVRIGNPDKQTNMEGVYFRDCKISGGDYHNCDLIQVHNISVMRFLNCDFANTSGHWIYFNNTVGKIYRVEFNQCSFTRSKKGIGIKMPISNSFQFLTIKDCGFSLSGEWEGGENKLICVEDNNVGDIRGVKIENITIQQLKDTYIPDYFFYGGNRNNVFDVDISFKRPLNTPLNKFMVTGIKADDGKIPVTAGDKIDNSTIELIKTFNNVILSGAFHTTEAIEAYGEVFNINQTLFSITKSNINFVVYSANGDVYPLYIENNICKTRKTIPINTTVYFYSMVYAI